MGIHDSHIESLPDTGILTFLLTDLQGSTWLWEAFPEQMGAVLRRHDDLIETAVEHNSGLVVKPRGEGDGRFIVFGRATQALLAADEIQRAMSREDWSIPEDVRIRIAIHTGEYEVVDGDYYGPTVNRCARLRSIAHGGQTLLTQITYDLVHDSLPQQLYFLDLGEHKLKDIMNAERVYQLVSPGLPAAFPPLITSNILLQNLPVNLTTFIGRDKELVEVNHLLTTRRLITITGPGGVGKTRLAVQAAMTTSEHFPDGGHFIDLTSIFNPPMVTQFVMSTLGIYEDDCCDPAERLKYYFQDKKMLLILDNCEHVLTGVVKLVQLLFQASINTVILATSREPLGVVGETIWFISPLSTPNIHENIPIESLMRYEAIALFVERAASVSDFVLTNENAEIVAQICARLDGIPLAIELAAARMKVLSAADLAERLDSRFSLLVSSQDVPDRQKTLRNLIDWSYDLLPDNERILLRGLSIFTGGWTLQAVEKVCGGDSIDETGILDLLIHLVDRSLVVVETVADGKRYRLLETIRQYSRQHLEENREFHKLARKHATYYIQFAERASAELRNNRQGFWLKKLDSEYDNLRAAMEYLESTTNSDGIMLRLASALWRYWRIRGYYQEGRLHLLNALSPKECATNKNLRAEALRGATILTLQQGDYDQATKLAQENLLLNREFDNKYGIGQGLDILGEINYYQGNYEQAVSLHTESLNLRVAIGDQEGTANSLRQLGIISRDLGDFQVAKARLTQSMELCRNVPDRILRARTLDNLGLVEHHLCNYESANQLFSEALSIYQDLNDRLGISNTLLNLGNAAKDQGNFRKARRFYEECLELKQTLGDKRGIAQTLSNLAELSFYQGTYERAAELAEQSLGMFRDLGVKRGIVFTLGLLAYIAQYNGEFERSASLANDCLQLAKELNAPRPMAYCQEVFGLIAYARGDLVEARQMFQDAIDRFERVGDRRNVANAMVNLGRTAYRQGDHDTAIHHVNESVAVSRELNIRWTLSLGLEILALLHRSRHQDEKALMLFQESLALAIEQDNRQGVANCLGGIAGIAAVSHETSTAVVLFGAAQKIRQEIGARMGSGDLVEYNYYLTLVHQKLTHREFDEAWDRGSTLSIDQMLELTQIQAPQYSQGIINRMEVVNEA